MFHALFAYHPFSPNRQENGTVYCTEASVVTALRDVALKRQTKLMCRIKEALKECVLATCEQVDDSQQDHLEWVSSLKISHEYTGPTGRKHYDRAVTASELLRASMCIKPSFFEEMVCMGLWLWKPGRIHRLPLYVVTITLALFIFLFRLKTCVGW
jgi:hypothetical protein